MKLEEYKITLWLPVEQVNQLAGLTRIHNDRMVSEGRCPGYTECSYLELLIQFRLGGLLSDELAYQQERLNRKAEAGDVPARNPAPEAAPENPSPDREEEEPETVSNAEEASADAEAAPGEEPETLITVRDASGVVREVTLDEAEEMREAAQGIYAGEPPEPDFEPDAPEEEEPEAVSNAEDKRSPLIKDNSDGYFYYLEHGHWPPDDEVLAGADVPCTGDYGLSDCLVVTQSMPDFVDAFFT